MTTFASSHLGSEIIGSEIIGSEIIDLEKVDDDLWHRLYMLTDDNDLVVVLGMVAAGKADAAVLGALAIDDLGALAGLDFTDRGIPASEFSRFQQFWYHFKVPYAQASLVWWYLFCLAIGRLDDASQALEQMTGWLGAMAGDPAAVLPAAADLLGLSSEVVVVTDAETTDLAALLTAVRRGAPLVAVDDPRGAAQAGRARGCDVIVPGAVVPGAVVPGATATAGQFWLGRPADLRDMPGRTRRAWQELPEQERADLLDALAQRVTSIEQVRFLLGETVVINRVVSKLLIQCRDEDVADWPVDRLALATLFRCWHEGGFVLQELNQSFISLPAIALFLTRRIREYGARLDQQADIEGLDVTRLTAVLSGLRQQIEQQYDRCLHFDGSNWERREFLLPRSAMWRPHEIPEGLRAVLHSWTGAEFPARTGDLPAWDEFLERALEAGSSSTRVMQAIAYWAANAEDLFIDMAVFTVPLGRKLDEPWTMDFTDLFCYTGFRDGFRPEDFAMSEGLVSIQNIMGQRMRYNAVKKAQNYAPVRRFPPQGFNLPDISVAEDANHAGHTAAGVRLACRVPITILHGGKNWNGIADVRLNRVEYRRDNRFLPHDLIKVNRYGQWAKGVADATYKRGLGFDEKWGNKVKDLEL